MHLLFQLNHATQTQTRNECGMQCNEKLYFEALTISHDGIIITIAFADEQFEVFVSSR